MYLDTLNKKRTLFQLIVFLFPVTVIIIPFFSGAIYALLILTSLFIGWSSWNKLNQSEKNLLFGFFILFLLIGLSLINTDDMSSGLKKIERYLHIPLIIPIYFLFRKYSVEAGKAFLVGIIVASFLIFGQAAYESIILGVKRAFGLYHFIVIGDISMWIAVIASCSILTVIRNKYHILISILSIILALSASILSGSRGAWAVLPVIFIWFIWLHRSHLSKTSVISIIILSVALGFGALNFGPIQTRMNAAISEYQAYSKDETKLGSFTARLEMWRDSIRIWKENPILGTGIGDFREDRLQFVREGTSFVKQDFGHAHNIYFDLLATTGLVGLLATLIFLLYIPFHMFYAFWNREADPWIRFYALAGMATILCFAVFGLSETWLARNVFVRTYMIALLVFMSSIMVRLESVGLKSKV